MFRYRRKTIDIEYDFQIRPSLALDISTISIVFIRYWVRYRTAISGYTDIKGENFDVVQDIGAISGYTDIKVFPSISKVWPIPRHSVSDASVARAAAQARTTMTRIQAQARITTEETAPPGKPQAASSTSATRISTRQQTRRRTWCCSRSRSSDTRSTRRAVSAAAVPQHSQV